MVSGVSFVIAYIVYGGANKIKFIWINTEQIVFSRGRCAWCLHACFDAVLLTHSQSCYHIISIPKPFGGCWQCWWGRRGEITSAPSVAQPILSEFGGQSRKARLGVWCAANASNSNTSMILFVCNEYCKNESLKHFYVHTGQNVVSGLHI